MNFDVSDVAPVPSSPYVTEMTSAQWRRASRDEKHVFCYRTLLPHLFKTAEKWVFCELNRMFWSYFDVA